MKKQLLLGVVVLGAFGANAQFWKISEPMVLPGTVNTEAEESMPVFSKDSSILYFTRTYDASNTGGEYDQDIWYSRRQPNGEYTECEKVKNINNKFNNAVFGVSRDGKSIYLLNAYEGKKDMEKGCAISMQKGNGWESPAQIEIPTLDIEGDFYGFHVNEDENIMIISYKGPGSVGEEDLYVSTKSGGAWSAPVHMGSTLNTTGFEISPFLNKTQDTLFFSSNGHGGQGDADIFYSVKQGSWTSWSNPVNLGPKVNSAKFDAYFSYSGNMIYWSSNKESERSDIYMAYILTPPPVSITCSSTNMSSYGVKDGRVDATVKGGVEPYSFSWTNGGTTEDIMGVGAGEYTVTVTDAVGQTASSTCSVTEPPAPMDISLKHFFDYNADKLTVEEGKLKEFVNGVEKIVAQGRPMVTITINSSASYVPTTTFKTNDKLAKSRAQQIEKELNQYFKSKGMDAKVKVQIIAAVVQGPKYEGDFDNQDKYRPYQFIELQTK